MVKLTVMEELLIDTLFQVAKGYQLQLQKLSIRKTLILVRNKLRMSQKTLAKRAKISQTTLSRIESGRINPTTSMLEKIFNALFCDLVFLPVPRSDLDQIMKERAHRIAEKRVRYLKGTMALELQQPNDAVLRGLVAREENELLSTNNSDIWSEEEKYDTK